MFIIYVAECRSGSNFRKDICFLKALLLRQWLLVRTLLQLLPDLRVCALGVCQFPVSLDRRVHGSSMLNPARAAAQSDYRRNGGRDRNGRNKQWSTHERTEVRYRDQALAAGARLCLHCCGSPPRAHAGINSHTAAHSRADAIAATAVTI